MPGPSNSRKNSKKRSKPRLSLESTSSSGTYASSSSADSQHVRTPPPISPVHSPQLAAGDAFPVEGDAFREVSYYSEDLEGSYLPEDSAPYLLQKPFIHDPGNGRRVRDVHAFLASPFNFAQPPALPSEDPLCAEFARDEVREMLCTVLPEETALILWYNKSRSTSRICPACQRLYRLGDILPNHLDDEEEEGHEYARGERPPPQLMREQEISGLCSTMCFILASRYNYPAAIKSAWGHMADEMDDKAWALLNSPRESEDEGNASVSVGLGMLVRMTRLHDLGLAQLCLPDIDFEGEVYEGWEDGDATTILAP